MNYDLYSTESKAVFIEVKKKYYWVNRPGRSESVAYAFIDRDKFGDARLISNLRDQMLSKMDDYDTEWRQLEWFDDVEDEEAPF